LAEQLAQEHKKLKNQVRFIKMVINKELIVSNRKRAELIEEMFQKGIVLVIDLVDQKKKIQFMFENIKTLQSIREIDISIPNNFVI
jgi:hypothetical protein